MTSVKPPFPSSPKLKRPVSPEPQARPNEAAPARTSPRETAGTMAPPSIASSWNITASETTVIPHFEKRSGPTPELPRIREFVDKWNTETRSPEQVRMELREARQHFAGLRERGEQTKSADGYLTNKVITPILNSENARNPGLNAVGCGDDVKMMTILKEISGDSQCQGREGHIRFHLGVENDFHRMAVDAFKHREGGFTLIGVDSVRNYIIGYDLSDLQKRCPDIIKGTMQIYSKNQVHGEGCRIFSVHTLNALHDYQPHFQNLHRQIHDAARGRPAPYLADPRWERQGETHYFLKDDNATFGELPGKFFKHMQVQKPDSVTKRTALDEAEAMNPALKDQPVNKKGQTLRQRFESLNPSRRPEKFSRADRTSSVDMKRLVLIDRALAYHDSH